MQPIRAYIGPAVFILYITSWIEFGIRKTATHFLSQTIFPGFISFAVLLVILPFTASLVVLTFIYLKLTPLQKHFVAVSGEVHLLFYLALILGGILTLKFEVTSTGFYVLLVLFILFYHLFINGKTVEDLNIKPLSEDTEYVAVAAILLFGLFVAFYFQALIHYGTFHLPSFEELVLVFLIVISQEITSKYYIQRKASEAFSELFSIVAASLLFSMLNFMLRPFSGTLFLYYFVGGLILSYGYARNENLSVPLILHGLINILPFIFLLEQFFLLG